MSKGSVPCPYFQWGRWKKERDKLSLPFHNLPNAISSLLATEVVSFLTYKIFSCIIFMSFVIFQGRKLILSSRNEVSGYLAMPVLSASYINQKKKKFTATATFHYLFLSCWLNFSHCLFPFNEKLFTPEAIFSQQTASIVTIFHLFYSSTPTYCKVFALTDEGGIAGLSQGSGFSPGSQDMPSLPETGQAPSKLSPAFSPSTAAGSLLQSSPAQVVEKHLLISWLCLLVTSL